MGVPIPEKPTPIKKCENCRAQLNLLPEDEEPDHAENCPLHPARLAAEQVKGNLLVRLDSVQRMAEGIGKYSMLPQNVRLAKISEAVQVVKTERDHGTFDACELDDFSVMVNSIRGDDQDEREQKVRDFFAPQLDRLSVIGIDLIDVLTGYRSMDKPKPAQPAEPAESAASPESNPAQPTPKKRGRPLGSKNKTKGHAA